MAGSTPISSALAKSSTPIRCFVSGPFDHWCARRPLALALALMAMGCSSCRRRSCAAGSSRRAIADTPADRPWRSQRPSRPSLSATQGRVGEQRCLAPAPQAPCSCTEHTGPARQENGWRFRTHNRKHQGRNCGHFYAKSPIHRHAARTRFWHCSGAKYLQTHVYRRRTRSSSAAMATADGVSECTQTVVALTGISLPVVVVTA